MYTEEQKNRYKKAVFESRQRLGNPTVVELANRVGVQYSPLRSVLTTLTYNSTFYTAAAAWFVLDRDLYELADIVGLYSRAQAWLDDPALRDQYECLKTITRLTKNKGDALETLLEDIPEHKREKARQMIVDVLEMAKE